MRQGSGNGPRRQAPHCQLGLSIPTGNLLHLRPAGHPTIGPAPQPRQAFETGAAAPAFQRQPRLAAAGDAAAPLVAPLATRTRSGQRAAHVGRRQARGRFPATAAAAAAAGPARPQAGLGERAIEARAGAGRALPAGRPPPPPLGGVPSPLRPPRRAPLFPSLAGRLLAATTATAAAAAAAAGRARWPGRLPAAGACPSVAAAGPESSWKCCSGWAEPVARSTVACCGGSNSTSVIGTQPSTLHHQQPSSTRCLQVDTTGGSGGGDEDASSRASSPAKSPLLQGASPFLDQEDQPLARQPPGARARASQQGLAPADAAAMAVAEQRLRPPSPLGRRPGLPNWQELAAAEGLAAAGPGSAPGSGRSGTPPARLFGGGAAAPGGLFGAAPAGGLPSGGGLFGAAAAAGGPPSGGGLFGAAGGGAAPSDPVTYQMQAALDKDGVPNLGEVQEEMPGAPAMQSPHAPPMGHPAKPQWHIPAVHTTPGSGGGHRGGRGGGPATSAGGGKRGPGDKPKPGAAFKLGKRQAYLKYLAYEVRGVGAWAGASAARMQGLTWVRGHCRLLACGPGSGGGDAAKLQCFRECVLPIHHRIRRRRRAPARHRAAGSCASRSCWAAATPPPPPSWRAAAARSSRRWAWSRCSSRSTPRTPRSTPRTACSASGAAAGSGRSGREAVGSRLTAWASLVAWPNVRHSHQALVSLLSSALLTRLWRAQGRPRGRGAGRRDAVGGGAPAAGHAAAGAHPRRPAGAHG